MTYENLGSCVVDGNMRPVQDDLNHDLPEIPHHRRNSRPEGKLQKSIIAWLQAHGAVAIRVNSGMIEKTYAGRRRFIRMNSQAGCSDVIACVPIPENIITNYGTATFVAIEVKTAKTKPTEKQSAFLERIRNAGGIAFVARSIVDLEENLPWLLK